MTVHEISLLDSYRSDEYWVLRVRIHVGSGTYIRILGEEIGKALGYPAVLKTLRRTSIGDFDIKNALSLDEM
jgi:tRNA pseudouridine55 synthase